MHTLLPPDPADTTITVDGRTLTHADLYGGGRRPGQPPQGSGPVAVIAHPTLDTVIAILAGLHAGMPVVPVPPDSGPAELRHILTDSRAHPPSPGRLTRCRQRCDRHDRPARAAPPLEAGDTALILYTSGTTGPPKGADSPRPPSPPISTPSPTPGSGPRRTPSSTACRCTTCTAWSWACSARCASGAVSSTPGARTGALRRRRRHALLRRPHGLVAAGRRPGRARALRPARLLVSGSAALPAPVFRALHGLTGHPRWSATA